MHSLSDNFNNLRLARGAFGWNYKAWFKPFKKIEPYLPGKCLQVLEIGAGRLSMASLMFDGVADEIVIGYYNDEDRMRVEDLLSKLKLSLSLVSKYSVKKVDALTETGKYDVVIMKSVLGGIFRTHNSDLEDIRLFVEDLHKRINENDSLIISIDNGSVIYQSLIRSFGARKNQWRFFKKDDLSFAGFQSFFGFLSGFSFETRLGFAGYVLDNYVIYPLDLLLSRIWTQNPTVIVSLFKSNGSSDFSRTN